jgi:hypothetical protein
MISTTERPFAFLYNFINNFNDYVEKDFYLNYEKQLNCNHIDKEKGIIYHSDTDDENNIIFYQEKLEDFLNNKIIIEIQKSKILVGDNYRTLIAKGNNPENYLFQTSADLVNLYFLSKNFKVFDLTINLHSLIIDYYNNFKSIVNLPKELIQIVTNKKSLLGKEKDTILSFKWNANKLTKLSLLYKALTNASPPFIEVKEDVFTKSFTGQRLEFGEGVKWVCKQAKNKDIIAKKTLVCLIDLLYDADFIKSDKNDFNKIIENIFLTPLGQKLTNIKGSRAQNSQSTTRINEIQAIVNSLT